MIPSEDQARAIGESFDTYDKLDSKSIFVTFIPTAHLVILTYPDGSRAGIAQDGTILKRLI